MPAEEVTNITEVKTASDGNVSITVEKYNDLVSKTVDQQGTINSLTQRLHQAEAQPPIVNRTTVIKTPEMVTQQCHLWGGGLMGIGASMFVIGFFIYRAG